MHFADAPGSDADRKASIEVIQAIYASDASELTTVITTRDFPPLIARTVEQTR